MAGMVCLVAGLRAQTQDQQQQQPPPFRTAVNAVRVDVSVTDRRDRPVDDLTATDFELREDGVLQRVDTAQFLRLTGTRTSNTDESLAIRSQDHAETEAARDDVRVFVIFLDDYHIDKDQRLNLRVQQSISRLVKQFGPNDLLAIMDPLTPISALRFTRVRDELLERVRKFEGRRGQLHPARSLLEEAQALRHDVWTVRGAVTLTALEGLVTYLGGLRDSRKSVLFVSQGPAMGRDLENRRTLEDILRAANRGNVTINTFDPRPLGEAPLGGALPIHQLAHETGGRAVTNANEPDDRLSQTIEDASAYYLLGYSPARDFADGKFHKIDVKVKRAGMRVTARNGYWAASAADMQAAAMSAVAPAVAHALSALAEPKSGRVADVWIGASRGEGGRTRMTVSWEASGRDGAKPAQVEIAPFEAGTTSAGPDLRALAPAQAIPATGTAVFEIDARTPVLFKIGIKAADGEILDRVDQRVVVPAFDVATGLTLSTPRLLRARSPLEARALAEGETPVPAASRLFRKTDRVDVEVHAHAPEGMVPQLVAQIQNVKGERLIDLTLRSQAGGVARVTLPLTSLPVGTYIVSLEAQLGEKTAQERVAFRIVP